MKENKWSTHKTHISIGEEETPSKEIRQMEKPLFPQIGIEGKEKLEFEGSKVMNMYKFSY